MGGSSTAGKGSRLYRSSETVAGWIENKNDNVGISNVSNVINPPIYSNLRDMLSAINVAASRSCAAKIGLISSDLNLNATNPSTNIASSNRTTIPSPANKPVRQWAGTLA